MELLLSKLLVIVFMFYVLQSILYKQKVFYPDNYHIRDSLMTNLSHCALHNFCLRTSYFWLTEQYCWCTLSFWHACISPPCSHCISDSSAIPLTSDFVSQLHAYPFRKRFYCTLIFVNFYTFVISCPKKVQSSSNSKSQKWLRCVGTTSAYAHEYTYDGLRKRGSTKFCAV